jgi:SNF2 family DNA or RNA helicase
MTERQKVLRLYQEEAIKWIVDRVGSGLFVDMGLGKTAATLYALNDLPKPVLLVAPIPVIENVWAQEASDWAQTAKLRFSLVRGSPQERTKALRQPADIYMINPELLGWLFKSYGEKQHPFKTLVVDESSMFKNPSSTRFKELRRMAKTFARRVILTGTPRPNSLLDLWSQLFIVDLGERLGTSFYRFRERYFYPIDYHQYKWVPKPEAQEAIAKLISDVVFRVDAKDHLPPRAVVHNRIMLHMDAQARKAYDSMERNALARLSEESEAITAATAVAVLMKLRQAANGFFYDEARVAHSLHHEKIRAAERIVEETGSPVVILYQFQRDLEELQARFPQGKVFGPEVQKTWNDGKVPVLFLHPQSGGHGSNLQYGGHTMIIYSASFSYEQMAQAMARIDRQGQEHPVVFHHLVTSETVDEMLLQVFTQKEQGQEALLDIVKRYVNEKHLR